MAAQLKAEYAPEVRALDSLLGTTTSLRWGYAENAPPMTR
jgi:hypothetical protein